MCKCRGDRMSLNGRAAFASNLTILNLNLFHPDLFRGSLRFLLLACLVLTFPARAMDAKRIITLSPHLAELVFTLGAGERLVGVSDYSDYPAGASSITRIGGAAGADVERILSLQPDLVLVWKGGTKEADISQLRNVGLYVVSIKGESIDDIPASLLRLGELLGRQAMAGQQATAFRQSMGKLSSRYATKPIVSVFIEVSARPLMALSNKHTFSAGLEACGVTNIFSDLSQAAANVSLESVLTRKPTYVLIPDSVSESDYADSLARYQQAEDGSVKGVVRFNADKAFRQTPRIIDAITEVCESLH
ncbi:MAG TPA: hypothetical protein DDW55_00405 [Gammaproteobacteria bacterium]|nr:hypothetical protein [Gammaproteobacteria bacterium]